ncbi:KdsC family phosphatase [Seleniivibrio woodruffii]|uniref:3-deoxy-D-manno-octulosonate 8-phosphate phosphatase (KDO 8-P phosphatase) n=1 Tax=Seleniivibrio woodruffii TaxID=1078050 RepID=A0A4R1K906_9BACT|nr:HAD-IIIA family hydrolase [Seleniivibrio woodruffii]TCK60856.1 3-deoxy-D-manno-octulosonate 8-phosphate phosphatase (KDO 8-P phosphatase) [Seleniivibrio woodruffii]TVZ36486.1 3-deoxy-D-manno-octulosonate 8-phosphate phosphatase (KDO 8-P phosphatase) [Seleniivibrio woodruffii]
MIKLLVLDVDGVLTDGGIIYDDNGVEIKRFDVKDGLGIKLAQNAGLEIAVISGRKSKVTELRCRELGIRRCFTGVKNKVECFESVRDELGVGYEETAFIGDDINDLALLKRVGFSATLSDSFDYIKSQVNYVTVRQGGRGAVREFIEKILEKNGVWENILKSFS